MRGRRGGGRGADARGKRSLSESSEDQVEMGGAKKKRVEDLTFHDKQHLRDFGEVHPLDDWC